MVGVYSGAYSQSVSPHFSYAHQIIDTLASPAMHGRGYVNKGDLLAANWIAGEFKKFELQSFEKPGNYFQYFTFPVNTFPGDVKMTFIWKDGRRETSNPGEHFLVRSYSPSVKGHFPVIHLDSSVVYSVEKLSAFQSLSLKKSFVLVDTAGVRDKKKLDLLINFARYPSRVKGILLPVALNPMSEVDGHTCSKLTPWDFAQVQSSIAVIEIERAYKQITEIEVEIGAKFIPNYKSQNVIGFVKGSQYPDSFIVFTAHYDHLGQMGKHVYFPGANDNASGIAMLLNLAWYYSNTANRPKYSIAFMAFGAEEVGLIGSRYYANNPLFPLKQIQFLINMDIMGTGDEGITVVNATLFNSEFSQLQKINTEKNYLPQVKPRGKAAISDHYFFTEKNVKCFYLYTLGGIKAYHDTCDRRETLPLTKFDSLFQLLVDFTTYLDTR